MSARPLRKVVVNRPPTDALNGNARRRSSMQVKKDLEVKISAKAAAERSINTAKHQQQARIANLEDILRKEDVLREKQSIRPDLQNYAVTDSERTEPEDVDELSDEVVNEYLDVVASEGDFHSFLHNFISNQY
jgi:vacuolar-type H+-ATPase subunit E/Vma4